MFQRQVLCCSRVQNGMGVMWKGQFSGENAVHCIQWWPTSVTHQHIQTCAPNPPFILFVSFHCHIWECWVCFKTDKIISFCLWIKLNIEDWVPRNYLRQYWCFHCYQNIEVNPVIIITRETNKSLRLPVGRWKLVGDLPEYAFKSFEMWAII